MRTSKLDLVAISSVWLVLVLAWAGCSEKKQAAETTKAVTETTQKTLAAPAPRLPGAWDPAVRKHLLQLVDTKGSASPTYDAQKQPVVVFDFDNTCIHGDIGRSFFDFMVTERKIRFSEKIWAAIPADQRAGIKAAWKDLSALDPATAATSAALQQYRKLMHKMYWSLCSSTEAEKCYPWQVRFYAGYRPDEITRMAAEVMKREIKRSLGSEQIRIGPEDTSPSITGVGIRVHEEIRELMFFLRRQGFKTWVITAGPQWVVKGAAKQFAMPPGQVIGMRSRLVDGQLSAEIEPPTTFREGKVQAIKKYIGQKPVLVLGDSWTDAEMLAYGEHAILIDHGYADLKKKALESGWWIQPTFPVH